MKKELHAKLWMSLFIMMSIFQLSTISAQTCDDILVTTDGNSISITGLPTANSEIQLFDEDYNDVFYCFMDCQSSTTIPDLTSEEYHLIIKVWDGDFDKICDIKMDIEMDDPNPDPCTDADGDQVCAADDCDDNDPNLPAAEGTACDDGNDNTTNDQIQSDGCSCSGTPTQEAENCDDIVITHTDNSISIAGLDAATTSQVSLWDEDGDKYIFCVGNCRPEETASSLEEGKYYIKVKLWNADFELVCDIDTLVCLGDGGPDDPDPCTDADGDQVCAADDCDDNNPNVPTLPGTPCDDMDQDTDEDVILDDGCTCLGTLLTGPASVIATNQTEVIKAADGVLEVVNQTPIFNERKDVLSAYPNPAISEDLLFVNLQNLAQQPGTIRIFNNVGQLMLQNDFQNVDDVQYEISLQKFETGIYWIHLNQKGEEPIIEKLLMVRE